MTNRPLFMPVQLTDIPEVAVGVRGSTGTFTLELSIDVVRTTEGLTSIDCLTCI